MNPKVLFVRSGNKGSHPITQNQGDSLLQTGCEVYYFDVIGKGWRGYFRNIGKLRSYIQQVKPDVIHAHYSLCGFLSTFSLTRLPIVVSLMGSDVLTARKWYLLVLQFFIRVSWKSVIVKSEEMRARLGWEEALIVPNGVNSKDFYVMDQKEARQKLGWSNESRIVLFAADPKRLDKNYPLFKSAFEILHSQMGALEEKHLFNLTKEQMNLYYNASDVLVMTSLHEGSPNVIKEAMFCQCPFVSVEVGDVKQWVDATSGNFIAQRKAADIAELVTFVLETKQNPNNQNVHRILDAGCIAQQLKQLYIRLINQ
ncbi:MAG: hypothetical protein RLY35_1966 [Bacteroidota bacterium]